MLKRNCLFFIFILVFLFSILKSQTEDPYTFYLKAINEKNQIKQIELFKEYLNKFGGQRTPYEKYVLANLALIYSKNQEYSHVVEYGEKALSFSGLTDFAKIQLYIALSDSYVKLKQNLGKAKRYGEIAIELSQAKLDFDKNKEKWIKLLGAGYYAKASALRSLNRNQDAIEYFIKAYQILKNSQIVHELKEVGLICYKLKYFDKAQEAFSLAALILKDFDSINFYAKSLYHNGEINKALIYFKEAYNKNPNSDTAYNIGIILAKDENNLDKAIEYLAKAVILNKGKKVEEARKLLEHLFFNVKKGNQKEFEKLLRETQLNIKKSS